MYSYNTMFLFDADTADNNSLVCFAIEWGKLYYFKSSGI